MAGYILHEAICIDSSNSCSPSTDELTEQDDFINDDSSADESTIFRPNPYLQPTISRLIESKKAALTTKTESSCRTTTRKMIFSSDSDSDMNAKQQSQMPPRKKCLKKRRISKPISESEHETSETDHDLQLCKLIFESKDQHEECQDKKAATKKTQL